MFIDLDTSLENKPLSGRANPGDFLKRHNEGKTQYNAKTRNYDYSQSLFHITDNLQGQIYHDNYLFYLADCWNSHKGVVISPDIIWYHLLTEVTQIVKAGVEKYRNLFTTTQEKQTIIVQTHDVTYLPLDEIVQMLQKVIPSDIKNYLLPTFSTSTDRSKFAHCAAFADMCSPYYDYCTMMCGIPKVWLQGTKEDWDRLIENWLHLTQFFTDEISYFSVVTSTLCEISYQFTEVDKDFLKRIFYMERCGSGSDREAFGWFTNFYWKQPDLKKVDNFSSGVAVVNYKNQDTDRNFVLKSGLFGSTEHDGFLLPEFSCIVYEKKEAEVASRKQVETIDGIPEIELKIESEEIIAKPRKFPLPPINFAEDLRSNLSWNKNQSLKKVLESDADYVI